jgi:fibronectin type III domain protein
VATQYHIYANDGAGGPVEYSTPIGTTADVSFSPPALAPGLDYTFAVRAFDPVSGLEEENTDVRVRIVLDAAGQDISGRPGAPVGLTARATKAGGVRVSWLPSLSALYPRATGFHVYAGSPSPNYASPLATVLATGARDYFADLTGLEIDTTYQVGVRAFNEIGEETNTLLVSVTVDGTPPDSVEELTATPIFDGG